MIEIKKNIALIDGDAIPWIVTHNKKLVDENGNEFLENKDLNTCILETNDIIKNILLRCDTDSYIIGLTEGKNFRHEIYPLYKANRAGKELPLYFREAKQYIKDIYKPVIRDNYECDDVIVSLKTELTKLGYNPILCSHDNDILKLEGKNFNIRKFEWEEISKEQAYIKFYHDLAVGQPGDNIKGIERFGEKAWENLKDIYYLSNDTLESLVFDNYLSKYGIKQGLENMLLNYKLLKIIDNLAIDNPEELIQKL